MSTPEDRLRPPPAERFAGSEHRFDLSAALQTLRSESHPAKDGHRQITLWHRGPVRIVLFAFDAGGRLPGHVARGIVTIQALRGWLQVETPGTTHGVGAGQMVVLDSGVPHDVRAPEASDMLLTVHLVSPTEPNDAS